MATSDCSTRNSIGVFDIRSPGPITTSSLKPGPDCGACAGSAVPLLQFDRLRLHRQRQLALAFQLQHGGKIETGVRIVGMGLGARQQRFAQRRQVLL